MRKLVVAAIAVVVVAIAAFFLAPMLMPPPDDLDLARSKASAGGLYAVSIAPEAEPVEQGPLHSWIVTVATPAGEAVADAAITVDGGMPQHGHGLPTAPQATQHLGEGRYRIEGVRFNMGGWWVLKLGISAAPGDDAVEFNVVL